MIKINDESENIDTLYNQLTNIDIEEQKKIWDERGKGYYGEFITFEDIYRNITGKYKILMNLNIPKSNNTEETTEIDILMIHETGIYVFECKHYKGTIYGNSEDDKWTQFFKTQNNEHFYNPVLQNKGHIEALKKLLPMHQFMSYIVFTNSECNLKVENSERNVCVCELFELKKKLNTQIVRSKKILDDKEIEDIFSFLLTYSHFKNIKVKTDDTKETELVDWIHLTINELNNFKLELNNELKKTKIANIKNKVIIVVSIISCILLFLLYCTIQQNLDIIETHTEKQHNKTIQSTIYTSETVNNTLNSFYDEIINEQNNDFIMPDSMFAKTTHSGIDISNICNITDMNMYQQITDNNQLLITSRLKLVSEQYGFILTNEAKYVVVTVNSNVSEYSIFDKNKKYYESASTISVNGRGYYIDPTKIGNPLKKADVLYIKLVGIKCFNIATAERINGDFEIEIFNKMQQ